MADARGIVRISLFVASILVALLVASLVLSAISITIELGQAEFDAKGDSLETRIPLIIGNGGTYDIEDLFVEFLLVNSTGTEMARSQFNRSRIEGRQSIQLRVPFIINMTELASRGLYHNLFDGDELTLKVLISFRYGGVSSLPYLRLLPRYPLLEFRVERGIPIHWTAPFDKFTLGAELEKPVRVDGAAIMPVCLYVSYYGALSVKGVPIHVSLFDVNTGEVLSVNSTRVDLSPGSTELHLHFSLRESGLAKIQKEGVGIRVELLGITEVRSVKF